MKLPLVLVATMACTFAAATVNVNTAQQSELQRTRGLDKVKAKAIIEWRAANGPIDNFTELQEVPGFSPELIDRLKPELAFEGDPYVPPRKEPRKKATRSAPRAPASR